MRIAICFSGQLRTAVHAAPQILKWIGPLINQCDFFIHTWNINTYKTGIPDLNDRLKLLANINLSQYDGSEKNVYVDQKDIEQIKILYNPKNIIVDDYHFTRGYFFNKLKQHCSDNEFHDYWKSLYYSFARSVKLKSKYEKKHNFKYDLVFKLRFDTSYPLEPISTKMKEGEKNYNQTSLSKEIEVFSADTTKFYANGPEPAEDFWFGSSETMNVAAEYYIDNLKEKLSMKEYLFRNNIQIGLANTNGPALAFHRSMVTDCPAHDWYLIYVLDRLFNTDYNFLHVIKNELDQTYLTKIGNALIEYNVVKNFCKTYGCTYSLG